MESGDYISIDYPLYLAYANNHPQHLRGFYHATKFKILYQW